MITNKLNTKSDHILGQELANRFFFVRTQGSQTHYWDSVNGSRALTKQHLAAVLIDEGRMSVPDDVDALTHALKIIKMQHFHPIVLEDVYRPYSPPVVRIAGLFYPNSWRMPLVRPRSELSAEVFIAHLSRMLGSAEKVDYLLDMIAYRYQKVVSADSMKPHVAFYFYGSGGMGKGIFGDTLEKVFGESAVTKIIDQAALNSMSAVDVWTRTWTIVEEVAVKAGHTDYNKIKTMVGGMAFKAARKGEHFKLHETPAQLIMNSNHPPTFIEPNDRRFFISRWETTFESKEAKDLYFTEYTNWLYEQDGLEAIAGLLKTRDISGVKVASAAMVTEEKLAVINVMQDQVVEDVKHLVEQCSDVICFTEDMFEHIWYPNQIHRKEKRHKLSEAGLIPSASLKCGTKNRQFWVRVGWQLVNNNGVKRYLFNKETSKHVWLIDDLGYQHSVDGKEHLVLAQYRREVL